MPAHKRTDIPHSAGVYQIRNTVDGKIYVGSARDLQKRSRDHFWQLKRGKHHSILLQRAWEKHGPTAFAFKVIEVVDDVATLIAREQEHLDRLRPFERGRGYNLQPVAGSSLGRTVGPETRSKIAAGNRGKVRSPEWRALIAGMQTGRRYSAEVRARVSAAQRGKRIRPESIEKMRATKRGKRHTEAHKAAIGAAMRRKPEVAERLRALARAKAKLTDMQRAEIQRRRAAGETLAALADAFGVRAQSILYWCHPSRAIKQPCR